MRVCIEPGCWQPTPDTRCTEHERAHQKARNAQPKRAAYRAHKRAPVPVGNACWCCGVTTDLTRHHVNALAAQRAMMTDQTWIPMCRRCNSSIGAKTMEGLSCPIHGGVEAARPVKLSDLRELRE